MNHADEPSPDEPVWRRLERTLVGQESEGARVRAALERERARQERERVRSARERERWKRRTYSRPPRSVESRRSAAGEIRARHQQRQEDRWQELADQEPVAADPTPPAPPAPPARMLSLASLLLAPGERENWLGELHTTRWELRCDPQRRRRETWGYFQALGTSLVASWRYRGDGPTQEAS